jgi:deazaflavin-dependent oxidoreductase (nitroreductase family)
MPRPRPEGLDAPWVPRMIQAASRANVWIYQKTDGRVWGRWYVGAAFKKGGVPICLLTTTGRKSGLARVTPLLFLEDSGRIVLVGSKGGLPSEPLWALNLRAQPECEVQTGARTQAMTARVTEGSERADLWTKLVALYADFDSYRTWTDRVLPVFVLEPR